MKFRQIRIVIKIETTDSTYVFQIITGNVFMPEFLVEIISLYLVANKYIVAWCVYFIELPLLLAVAINDDIIRVVHPFSSVFLARAYSFCSYMSFVYVVYYVYPMPVETSVNW